MSIAHNAASRTASVSQGRYKVGGLNLPAGQITSVPDGLKTETVIIPSTSVPSWGSYFVCDIKEVGYIHDIKLQFNVSALTATGGTSNRLVPAIFWPTRIEIVQNSQVIDTIFPVQQWVLNQIIQVDEDRLFANQQMGLYSSATLRATKAASAGDWFVPLKTYFNQTSLPILTSAHNIQMRVYMDTLANVYAGGGTAPVNTINFCNALVTLTRMPSPVANSLLNAMQVSPQSSIMHTTRYGTFNVASGVSSTTIVLTPIVGRVAALFFVVRTVGSTNADNTFTYTAISNFAILNSSSTNIVGGQSISSALSLNVLGQYNCASSYLTETALGLVNNGAHVYIWSFSTDILDALVNGKALSSYTFTGNEQLQVNFTGALGSAAVVDVFAITEAIITQTPSGINVAAM